MEYSRIECLIIPFNVGPSHEDSYGQMGVGYEDSSEGREEWDVV